MKQALIPIVLLLVIAGAIYMEMQVWNECREKNSFWYCMRMISK